MYTYACKLGINIAFCPKTYNENKDIYMDGEFKDAKLWTGKHYIYDENGLLERIEVYKDGKYVGNGVL